MVSFCHTGGVVYKSIKWEEENFMVLSSIRQYHFSTFVYHLLRLYKIQWLFDFRHLSKNQGRHCLFQPNLNGKLSGLYFH